MLSAVRQGPAALIDLLRIAVVLGVPPCEGNLSRLRAAALCQGHGGHGGLLGKIALPRPDVPGQLLRRRGRPHGLFDHVAAVVLVADGEAVAQRQVIFIVVGQRRDAVDGVPRDGFAGAVRHDDLRVGIGAFAHIGAGIQQDRVAALAAVEHLQIVVVLVLGVPPDAVHRKGGVGVAGHHAEQAAAAAHHAFTRNGTDERILGTQLRRRRAHPLLQGELQIVGAARRAADIRRCEEVGGQVHRLLTQLGKGGVIAVPRRGAIRIMVVFAAVVDADGPDAGDIYLAGCQRQHHRQRQQQTEDGIFFHRILLSPLSTYRLCWSLRRRSGHCCRHRCPGRSCGGSQWCGYSCRTAP